MVGRRYALETADVIDHDIRPRSCLAAHTRRPLGYGGSKRRRRRLRAVVWD